MKIWILVGAVLLAGCSGKPAKQASSSTVVTSPTPAFAKTGDETRQRARTFTDLASAYYSRAQYKIALDELRKAIGVDRNYGPAYDVYGQIYMELGEDALAEENFRRAIDLDKNDSRARNNYGWFLCSRGRYDEGSAQFSAALQNPLYSQPELALANAGLCAEKKGDVAQAEASLMKALKLHPNNPGTLLQLSEFYFRQNRLNDAQRMLSDYAGVAQPSAQSLWLEVRLERRLGDRAQEAAAGLQLRKRFPDSKEARQLQAGQYE